MFDGVSCLLCIDECPLFNFALWELCILSFVIVTLSFLVVCQVVFCSLFTFLLLLPNFVNSVDLCWMCFSFLNFSVILPINKGLGPRQKWLVWAYLAYLWSSTWNQVHSKYIARNPMHLSQAPTLNRSLQLTRLCISL